MRRRIMPDEQLMWEKTMINDILGGFDLTVDETRSWLSSPAAKKFFFERNGRISSFFSESGIDARWNKIIEERALRGADITEQIYDYARSINMEDNLREYTLTERAALNRLCDYNYELIRNVTADEVMAIRRKLVQDFAKGTYPLRTSLKELQLEPINGFSPEARAEMIARTESARTLNVSSMETMRNDGVERVFLYGCDETCEECGQYMEGSDFNTEYPDGVPIDVALEVEVPHPHCTGVWIAARNSETGLYTL